MPTQVTSLLNPSGPGDVGVVRGRNVPVLDLRDANPGDAIGVDGLPLAAEARAAIPTDGSDAYDAFQAAIVAAQANDTDLILPAGTIDLTKVDGGGLKIAAGSPLRIRGQGQGRTIIRLSREVPRLFDLDPRNLQDQTFDGIHLSAFTCDANNVTHLALAPETTITAAASIAGGFAWTRLSLTSNAAFQRADSAVWFLPTNVGTAQSVVMGARPIVGSTTDIEVQSATARTVEAGDKLTGAFSSEHCLIGNRHSNKFQLETNLATLLRTNFKNITIEDVTVKNLPALQVTGLGQPTPSQRFGVGIYAAASPSVIENIAYRRLRIEGGDCGTWTVAAPGSWIDNVVHEDCYHDRGAVPTANYSSLNFMVGGDAWVGRVAFKGANYGRNSGDVGIEVDQAMFCDVSDATVIEDAYSACYYFSNFAPPARTAAGPPTTTITTSGGINAAATTVNVAALPGDIDQEGYAKIGNELVHYDFTSTTALRIRRGMNGSTAATHAEGAKLTFVLNRRQMFKVAGHSRRALAASGSGLAMYTNYALPLPSIRLSGGHERVANNAVPGECVQITGICSLLDVDGYLGSVSGNTSQAYSLFLLDRIGPTSEASVPAVSPERVRFGDVELRASGNATGGSLRFVQLNRGHYNLDVRDLRIYNGVRGLVAATRGISAGDLSPCTVAADIKMKVWSNDQTDAAFTAVNLSGNTTNRPTTLDLDLFNMSLSGGAGSTNYLPYQVNDATVLRIRRIIHPYALGFTVTHPYPETPEVWAGAKTSAYTASHRDRIIPCNTNAAAAGFTITLPLLGGGNASVGPKPGTGARITVLDVSDAAGTKNVTIAPATGEKISGITNGTTVINTNGGRVTLIGDAALGWWPV